MVKSEVFGTRPSILKPILENIPNTTLITDLWFITAIEKINPDPSSRYLLIKECLSREEFFKTDLNLLQPFLHRHIPQWLIHRENGNVLLEWEETPYEEVTEDELVEKVLKKTGCRMEFGRGIGSTQASPFSRFFRNKMGDGFSLTDFDYLIVKDNRLALFEEKTFLRNGNGLVGYGQYRSFGEICSDVLLDLKSVLWWLVFISDDELLVYDAGVKGFPERETVRQKRWGKMVTISDKELERISKKKFKRVIKEFFSLKV